MPRTSSRSSSPARAPARAAPAAPRPAASHAPATQQQHAAPPAVAQPARGGGLMGTIMEGMAFGTGSAIAHRAVGAVMGSMGGGGAAAPEAAAAPTPAHAAPASAAQATGCDIHQQDFSRCLRENKSDIASCQMFLDNHTQCLQDSRLH